MALALVSLPAALMDDSLSLDPLDCGGLFSQARRHRATTLARVAAMRFAHRRQRQLDRVIASSDHLRALAHDDLEHARRKAIQAIRRAPSADRPEIIGASERRALAEARQHLGEMAWTHHRPADLAALIAERAQRDRGQRERQYFIRRMARRFRARLAGEPQSSRGPASSLPRCQAQACAEIVLRYHRVPEIPCAPGDIHQSLARPATHPSRPVITLVQFACVRLDAAALMTSDPAAVVQPDVIFAIPRRDRRTARRLVADLRAAGADVRFRVLLSDVDPERYILPILGPGRSGLADRDALSRRLRDHAARYREAHHSWLETLDGELVSWSSLAAGRELPTGDRQTVERWLGAPDLRRQIELMDRDFEPGGYFASVPRPSPSRLADMAVGKCALYAAQGQLLPELFPGSAVVVLQNEAPLDLRTRMLVARRPVDRPALHVIAPYPDKRVRATGLR